MLINKVYIGSWELAKRTILENFMLKTIVSCPQISDSEKYLYLQIPIVSWMFPKMLPKKLNVCQHFNYVFHRIYKQYSTQVINILVLLCFFLFVLRWRYWPILKKLQKNTLIMVLLPAPSYGVFVVWVCFRFWKTTFCLNSRAKKLKWFFWNRVLEAGTEQKNIHYRISAFFGPPHFGDS